MDTLLEINNLKVIYETERGPLTPVDRVTLKVLRGETLCLVGESGCGKSTLALAIPRLLPPNAKIVSGQIIYKGNDLLKLDYNQLQKVRGREIAIIFQNPMSSLNPVMRVGHQVAEVPVFQNNMTWSKAVLLAIDQLGKVGLPDPAVRARDFPHAFSGGMKQRSMIAMMTVAKPDLLIADEPTTALDVTIQAQIIELLQTFKVEYQLTLILITHNFGIVAEICDRVAVMYSGKVIEIANTFELFKEPIHPYTRGLIECAKVRAKPKTKLYQIPGSPPDMINPPPGCRFHPRCPFATEKCSREEPPLMEVNKNHFVACHLNSSTGDKQWIYS
ncbi:MAG: ABC transporter ATP-binding protein [Desulfurococcaceae archaeon]